MRTGSIERNRAPIAKGFYAKLSLWIGRFWQGLVPPAGVLQEEEMPDWLKRDIGWCDGPAERPRALVEGWDRRPLRTPRKLA